MTVFRQLRWTAATAIVATTVLLLVQSPVLAAGGARTIHILNLYDHNAAETYVSQACGFEVTITGDAVYSDFTLRYNADGLVVSETDTFGGGKWTYTGPGGSFVETEAEVGHYDYPGGARPGSPISGWLSGSGGLFLHVTGHAPSLAGQIIFTGTVTYLDANGIPQGIYDVTDLKGNPVDDARLIAGYCGALSGDKPGAGT
jgi:hypothetical protein